jgi:hypothetical protein
MLIGGIEVTVTWPAKRLLSTVSNVSLVPQMELLLFWCVLVRRRQIMGFARGALLWLLGVPLPIILLLALFWHH